MNKQEEISEGIARLLYGEYLDGLDVDDPSRDVKFEQLPKEVSGYYLYIANIHMDYLHSQGLRLPNGESLIDETNE